MQNPSDSILNRYSKYLDNRYVNKYALFIRYSIDSVKSGGLIALLVPTSFISGPYFGKLRKSILEDTNVVSIELLDQRNGIFIDVLQDTCILFLKKKKGAHNHQLPECRLIDEDGKYKNAGYVNIPDEPSIRPWILPFEMRHDLPIYDYFSQSFSRLSDYGYGVRTGYYVWNREKDRCREGKKARKKEFPLIWAHSVKANRPCKLESHRIFGKNGHMSLIKFKAYSEALIDKEAIILQRTTTRTQDRRIIAGYITKRMITEFQAFISENHTIVIYPLPGRKKEINLRTMCRLLNSKPVDLKYRQVSGTATVSVNLLKGLPLPPLAILKNKLRRNLKPEEFDKVVDDCYSEAYIKNGQ